MRQKKKLVIFQSDPHLEQLPWQDMAEQWKCELGKYPDEIGAYRILLMKGSLQADSFREEIGDADAVLGPGIHPGLVNETFFRLHPNVKYIATLDHGYREFDRDITKKYGVTVTNTIYGDRTIAQYAMALLLNICHDVSRNSHFTKKEYWEKRSRSEDVNYFSVMTPQIELFGKTLGIVGLGKIGSRMAEMALGMGMKVIACRRTGKSGASPAKPGDSLKIAGGSLEQVSFGELLERADVISIHCPLTSETERMFDYSTFDRMRRGVILINTARGGIIDEEALLDALNTRKVYMAGLDVVAEEPPAERLPLMESPYTYITSHIAWQPREARLRAVKIAVENYISYLHGKPVSVIS